MIEGVDRNAKEVTLIVTVLSFHNYFGKQRNERSGRATHAAELSALCGMKDAPKRLQRVSIKCVC